VTIVGVQRLAVGAHDERRYLVHLPRAELVPTNRRAMRQDEIDATDVPAIGARANTRAHLPGIEFMREIVTELKSPVLVCTICRSTLTSHDSMMHIGGRTHRYNVLVG